MLSFVIFESLFFYNHFFFNVNGSCFNKFLFTCFFDKVFYIQTSYKGKRKYYKYKHFLILFLPFFLIEVRSL